MLKSPGTSHDTLDRRPCTAKTKHIVSAKCIADNEAIILDAVQIRMFVRELLSCTKADFVLAKTIRSFG